MNKNSLIRKVVVLLLSTILVSALFLFVVDFQVNGNVVNKLSERKMMFKTTPYESWQNIRNNISSDNGIYWKNQTSIFTPRLGSYIPSLTDALCSPTRGTTNTLFTFSVNWSDLDGDSPADGYLTVNISKGAWSVNESMIYVSGDNSTGAIYSYSSALPGLGRYSFSIFGSDGTFTNATGIVTLRNSLTYPVVQEVGLWDKYPGNPILMDDSGLAGFASVLKNGSTYHMYYSYRISGVLYVGHATSGDGKNWSKDTVNNPVLAPSGGEWDASGVLCPLVWVEDSIWYMLYRGDGSYGHATGLAVSSDGISWVKNASNPVLIGDNGQWDDGQAEPWGIIKVENTYYLWYGRVSATRSYGLATSTNLTSWTKDLYNPIYTDQRYCPDIFKYGGYYFMVVPHRTRNDDYSEIELYRDVVPTFYPGDREFLGVVYASPDEYEIDAWDNLDHDTPWILTDDVYRDSFAASNNGLWMYFAGQAQTGVADKYKTGLTIELSIVDALGLGAPMVSNPVPLDGAVNVNTSLSLLQFSLNDISGDLMNYSVETVPGIGNGSGANVGNGTYSISVSGLSSSTVYTWYVNVTDGLYWVNKTFMLTTESGPLSWWNDSWLYRMSFLVNHTNVDDNLVDFPVLVRLNSSNFNFSHAQSLGEDIRFVSYDGTSFYDYEIERWNSSLGMAEIWVRIPIVYSNSVTGFFMYYGNNLAVDAQNITGVWNSHYCMVQHLDETSGIVYDSTGYGNNGMPYGTMNQDVVGLIDGADGFDGVDDRLEVLHNVSLNFGSKFSVELWIKRDDVSNAYERFVMKYNTTVIPRREYGFYLDSSNLLGLLLSSNGSDSSTVASSLGVSDTSWHYVVAVFDSGSVTFYKDLISDLKSSSITSVYASDTELLVGCSAFSGRSQFFDGVLDEVRLSDVAWNSSWINACYHNGNGSLISVGIEETSGPSPEYYLISLKQYWNMISIPFNNSIQKTDIIVSYNNQNYSWNDAINNSIIIGFVYGWNRTTPQNYELYETLIPGEGYWIWAYSLCQLKLIVPSVNEDDNNITALQEKWNIVGIPLNTSKAKEDLIIYYNGTDYTWEEAVDNDIILGFIYGWNRDIQNYILSDDFDPGFGYWMYAYQNCTLKKN